MKKIFLILFVCFFAVNLSAQEDSIKTNKFYFSFYNATSLDYYYGNKNEPEKLTDIQKEYTYRYLFIPFDMYFMLGYKRAELGFGISRFRFSKKNSGNPNYTYYGNERWTYPNLYISTYKEYSFKHCLNLKWLLKANYMFLSKDKYNLKLTAGYGPFMSIGLLSEYNLNKQTSLYASISYQKTKYHYGIYYHQKEYYRDFNDRISFRLGIRFNNKQTNKSYNSIDKYRINIGTLINPGLQLNYEDWPLRNKKDEDLSKYFSKFVPFIGVSKTGKKVLQSINFGYGSYSDNYFGFFMMEFPYFEIYSFRESFKYSYYTLFYDVKMPIMLKNKRNKMIYIGTQIYLDYVNLKKDFTNFDANTHFASVNYNFSVSLPLLMGYRASFKHFSFDTGISLQSFKYYQNNYYDEQNPLSKTSFASFLNFYVLIGLNL